MKKQLDIDKINDLLWKMKQVVFNEPEDEVLIAILQFNKFIKKKEAWVQRYDEES